MKKAHRAEGTLHMYATKLGHVVRIFGEDARMADITPTNIDRFVEQRTKEGASKSTIGKELTAIAQLCKVAKRGGAYPGDVKALRPVGFSIGYEPRIRTASWGELAKLRAVAKPQQFAFVMLIVCTACRLSEAKRALPEHYDKAAGLFSVQGTKTAESAAKIPLLSVFRQRFEADVLPYLPISWSNPSHGLPRLCAKAGIPPLTPNDLRRTAATLMVAAGVSTGLVARMLRHKDSRMVERVYGRASAAEIGAAIERQIDARVFDGSAQVAPNATAFGEQAESKNAEENMGEAVSEEGNLDLKSFASNGVPVRIWKGLPLKTQISEQTAEAVFDESAPDSSRDFAAALAEAPERARVLEAAARPLAKGKSAPYLARRRA